LRLIVKNLNVLRSIINVISRSFEIQEIVEAAGANLPSLFHFSSFGLYWKEGASLYLYQESSCSAAFTQEVVQNMVKVFTLLGEEPIDANRITVRVEKHRLNPNLLAPSESAALKSHLTLPLTFEGGILGCISLSSDQPNAFDAQDLQFFSVIGYQMAATLKHFQRFSTVKNMAIYDTLTGLYNRRYVEERLGIEADKSFKGPVPLSLVMVDIDHFKRVNDTFGHTEGDRVLREISSALKSSVRKKDIVARYGGEEFILILPETNLEESCVIAERIRRTVETTPFEVGNVRLSLTISLGISSFPDHHPESKEELVAMADQALYDAKRGGRNQVCVFRGETRLKAAKG
jgi:diguanylate cyclase (GGDEF)-like protein